MTGPVIAVAWQSRFVDGKWSECSREHVEWVRSVPHEWPGYEVRELYAAPQPAPAIDLEQFREAVESLRLGATRAGHHEECDRLLALIDGQAKLQASLNEQFGNPEELRTAIRGFIAASWMPSKDEATDEMRQTYAYWHKQLIKHAGAMGYVEAEEIALQPTKGEGRANVRSSSEHSSEAQHD